MSAEKPLFGFVFGALAGMCLLAFFCLLEFALLLFSHSRVSTSKGVLFDSSIFMFAVVSIGAFISGFISKKSGWKQGILQWIFWALLITILPILIGYEVGGLFFYPNAISLFVRFLSFSSFEVALFCLALLGSVLFGWLGEKTRLEFDKHWAW